jgi:hypothetical protein
MIEWQSKWIARRAWTLLGRQGIDEPGLMGWVTASEGEEMGVKFAPLTGSGGARVGSVAIRLTGETGGSRPVRCYQNPAAVSKPA